MDEPDRMLEQTSSSLERALLEEGCRYRGPADLRAHTMAALGLAATAGLASGGALAWLAAKSGTAKLLMALSVVTLMAGVPVSYVLLRQAMAPVAAPAGSPAVAPGPVPEAPASPAPAFEAELPAAAPTPAPPRAAPMAPARAATASTNSALRAELAALDVVRSTLADDDSTGALVFLDAYFRTFPRGRLRLEAETLRIDALAKAGRPDAAKRYAREFLKRNPNSVLSARVEPYAGR